MADVPFFAAQREWAAHADVLEPPIEAALRSGRWLQGPEVTEFEAALCECTGRRHAVSVGSGTDALFFALAALGIGPGDEVIVPDFSFVATASSVVRTGAAPVWADVDDEGILDLDHAATLVTPRTAAVIPVALFGRPLDPAPIEAFAASHGLAVVEDAAQAFGAAHPDRPSGGVGAISCLSFDPTKPLSAPGSGGALLTDDDAIAATVRKLRWHGRDASWRPALLGYNSQLPTAAAAVLGAKLALEPGWRARRREIAARYTAAGFAPLTADPDDGHAYSKYVIRLSNRERVRNDLSKSEIPTLVHYPAPLHRQPVFAAHAPPEPPPRALLLCEEVLSLPIHAFLRDDEVDRVAAALDQAAQPSGQRPVEGA